MDEADLLEKEEKSRNVTRYLSLIKNRVDAMRRLTEEMTMETVHVNSVPEESIAAFFCFIRVVSFRLVTRATAISWRADMRL